MQEPDYNALRDRLSDQLREAIPEVPAESVRARVAREFDRLTASGLLDVLSPDEIALLGDYRTWKVTPASVGGVFHWRKHEA